MNWNIGYVKSNLEEGEIKDLKIYGDIPKWLNGALVRNGPAEFKLKHQMFNHWFDGFAKIHEVKFKDGKVFYQRKFVRSKDYIESNKAGELKYDQFGTNTAHPVRNKLLSFLSPNLTDNASVNILKVGKNLVALSETPNARLRIDKNNLNTLGEFVFNDNISEHISTGHILHDEEERKYYGYSTKLGPVSHYIVFSFSSKDLKRDVIKYISTSSPSYMHSFAVSKNYICLTENPVKLNPAKILFSAKTLAETLRFNKSIESCFLLLNKSTGNLFRFTTKPFFTFHHVNMFETENAICIDLIEHRGLYFIKCMEIKSLLHNHIKYNPGGKLVRYKLNLKTKKVHREMLLNGHLELSAINNSLLGKKYRYIYMLNADIQDSPYHQIIKFDGNTNEVIKWEEEGCFPSEPAFALRPNSEAEDDGVILSFIVNVIENQSFVLILNAKDLKEICRIIVPEIIPFGSHGGFYRFTPTF